MKVIGLTGGIASGKSTVARMLAELGARVVDADEVARQIVAPGQPALAEIVAAFGAEVPDLIDSLGALDRKKLGALVFADAAKRRILNGITHPRIGAATQERLAALRTEGVAVAVYEAALLVENQVYRALDGLVVVSCSAEEQLARIRRRDELTEDEARLRIGAQLPLADKVAVADWVIDTNGPLVATRAQVNTLWAEINK